MTPWCEISFKTCFDEVCSERELSCHSWKNGEFLYFLLICQWKNIANVSAFSILETAMRYSLHRNCAPKYLLKITYSFCWSQCKDLASTIASSQNYSQKQVSNWRENILCRMTHSPTITLGGDSQEWNRDSVSDDPETRNKVKGAQTEPPLPFAR